MSSVRSRHPAREKETRRVECEPVNDLDRRSGGMLALGAGSGQDRDPMSLSERDVAILEFERIWRHLPGPKQTAIRQRLHLSPSRYYELLNELLDSPEAEAHDILTVRRARRVRDSGRRSRIEGRRADPRSR
jgi:Protein of unknown function (DUF3263)